ncbi:hypothetical protein Pmani_030416 [Petrolisthes manimaculis]|uniref:Uncharacterized protein n=1 Tax=Petrolisthes manimaculis TaxID=1843537 RepID=A0AAE1NWQ4_9EUCA|nr:hypothetical protein Pmani_030416 [Petrolisthes manimaculis]
MSLEIKKRKVRAEPRIRWWKLNEDEYSRKFREEVSQVLGDKIEEDRWETISEVVRQKAKKVLGVTSGRRKEDKETWWWNEEVQKSISKKKRAKMKWMKKVSRSIRKCRAQQRRRWPRQRTRHMRSCTRSWIVEKGKKTFTDWPGRETELDGMCSMLK